MIINTPISLGELLDKISILQIKQKKIQKLDKLKLINEELKLLEKILNNFSKDNLNLKKYLDKLITVNLKLWKIEDDIRECERNKKFDQKFIDLARSVYLSNDDRAKIKLEINEKFGSTIIEVKSYERY
tara:strand:- start:74 stop:460 length:387 start_codon:yes stop_codon:yes gene_type:complete